MKENKLRFEDLQSYVDMLCDALENKGASSSGIPHNENVCAFADKYRKLLEGIRKKQIGHSLMIAHLNNYSIECMIEAKDNQNFRIFKILQALDSYVKKEYNRVNREGWQSG